MIAIKVTNLEWPFLAEDRFKIKMCPSLFCHGIVAIGLQYSKVLACGTSYAGLVLLVIWYTASLNNILSTIVLLYKYSTLNNHKVNYLLSIAVNLKSMSLRIPTGSLHALTYFVNIS